MVLACPQYQYHDFALKYSTLGVIAHLVNLPRRNRLATTRKAGPVRPELFVFVVRTDRYHLRRKSSYQLDLAKRKRPVFRENN